MIIVDVANVGMHGGCGTLGLCRIVQDRFPDVQLITGGGIRDLHDLFMLADNGCNGALVSSALHDGWLTAEDIAEFCSAESES